jgi:hypothetical protein
MIHITKKTFVEFDEETYIKEKYKNLFESKNLLSREKEELIKKHRNAEYFQKSDLDIQNYKYKKILRLNKSKFNWKIIPKIELCKKTEIKPYFDMNNNSSLPELKYNILKANKNIKETLDKLIAEKRGEEELEKKLKEFSKKRASYKSNLINKFEKNKLINYYIKSYDFEYKFLKNINKIHNIKKTTLGSGEATGSYYIKKPKININNNSESSIENHKELSFDGNKTFKIKNNIQNIDTFSKELKVPTNKSMIVKNIMLKNIISNSKDKLITNCLSSDNPPPDTVNKLVFHSKLFRHKFLYKKVLNLEKKEEKSHDSSMHEFYRPRYNEEEEDEYGGNIYLSAFQIDNMKKINKMENNTDEVNEGKENILKRFRIKKNYHLYRDNYLKLRKSLNDIKKIEYNELVDEIRKNNKFEKVKDDFDNLEDDGLFRNKLKSLRKERTILNLSTAILNPNDSTTFPKCYLPKNGSLLLSRDNNIAPILKK